MPLACDIFVLEIGIVLLRGEVSIFVARAIQKLPCRGDKIGRTVPIHDHGHHSIHRRRVIRTLAGRFQEFLAQHRVFILLACPYKL